jgi:hypothetical protein
MSSELLEDYRKRAAECDQLAAEAQNPRARETFLYVAAGWRALMAADEEFERKRILSQHEALSPAK